MGVNRCRKQSIKPVVQFGQVHLEFGYSSSLPVSSMFQAVKLVYSKHRPFSLPSSGDQTLLPSALACFLRTSRHRVQPGAPGSVPMEPLDPNRPKRPFGTSVSPDCCFPMSDRNQLSSLPLATRPVQPLHFLSVHIHWNAPRAPVSLGGGSLIVKQRWCRRQATSSDVPAHGVLPNITARPKTPFFNHSTRNGTSGW